MIRGSLLLLATAAILPLSGCISFSPKPPKALLTLTSAVVLPVGAVQNSATAATVTVAPPGVPAMLATQRVPVQTGGDIAYVPDALWIEPPQRLFTRLLSDTLAARAGRLVLSPVQGFADPGPQLSGELRSFGVDASGGSQAGGAQAGGAQAVVTFDAQLVRRPGKSAAIERRRFEARVPISEIAPEPAAQGINAAANQVAADVSDWVGR